MSNNNLYLLGLNEIRVAKVQPWTQRIDSLVESGEWLQGLALALDHYQSLEAEAAKRAERDRFPPVFCRDKRNDQCMVNIFLMSQTNQRTAAKEDVFRHEDGEEVQWCVGDSPYAADVTKRLEEAYHKARNGKLTGHVPMGVSDRTADLLMDYVRLAVAHVPSGSAAIKRSGIQLDLTSTHYQMLAGVCIEYCATIHRMDLLFGEIFRRFQDCHQVKVFVELLEPYILSDKLHYLAPEALQEFVNHFTALGQVFRVEQCLLHLQVKELDFDTVLKLCQKHKLYSAMVYIYNNGLNDWITPINTLIAVCKPSRTASPKGGSDSAEVRTQRLLGYKLMLYISYCFQGQEFPSGRDREQTRILNIRSQVACHLFDRHPAGVKGSMEFPNLSTLLRIDCTLFLKTLNTFMETSGVDLETSPGMTVEEETPRDSKYKNAHGPTKCPTIQHIMLSLAEVVFHPKNGFHSIEKCLCLAFEAKWLSSGLVDIATYTTARAAEEPSVLDLLFRYLAVGNIKSSGSRESDNSSSDTVLMSREDRQALLLRLLQKVSKDQYDEHILLKLISREKMNRTFYETLYFLVLMQDDRSGSSALP